MKKIPTIFIRDPENMKRVLPEINPVCQWVFDGEGVATRKYDGTCCMIDKNGFWKRREIKKGKSIPEGFIQADYDENTGKTVGWMPVTDSKEDRWHNEALQFAKDNNDYLPDGMYELCGPKIQGNPEGFDHHVLILHDEAQQYEQVTRTFEGIKAFLSDKDTEGLVFHHPDGRMAKIKKRDFG